MADWTLVPAVIMVAGCALWYVWWLYKTALKKEGKK